MSAATGERVISIISDEFRQTKLAPIGDLEQGAGIRAQMVPPRTHRDRAPMRLGGRQDLRHASCAHALTAAKEKREHAKRQT
jgi:hypothetical protein